MNNILEKIFSDAEDEVVTIAPPEKPPSPSTAPIVDTVYKNLEDYTTRGQKLPPRHLFDQEVRPHIKDYKFGRRIYYRRKDVEDFVEEKRMDNSNYGGSK